MNQMALQIAEVLRDVGIQRSADRAERVNPGWQSAALAFVKAYCIRTTGIFSAEDVVDAYECAGLVQPTSTKAWGSVIQKAQRTFLMIRVDREGVRRKGHCSPCNRYKSLVYGKRYTEVA